MTADKKIKSETITLPGQQIPYGRQDICEADIQAVIDVLRSDYLTQGPMVPRFEQSVAEYCGAVYAVAVNSATSALHIACRALGLGPGDWLWTSPITFVASANCALYCSAKVDFIDIDPMTYNLSTDKLEKKLHQAEGEGRLPKIVIPVHFAGQSCDMKHIHQLAQQYGFKIIEDASHAIGGRYRDESIGNCRYSDITVFSFHPVKIITTGEGGMAVTNTPALAERMALLRSHGITRDPALMTRAPEGPWYYQQIDLGFNYRMTDLQAALGFSQMARVDVFVSRRHELAKRYDAFFMNMPATSPFQHPDSYSSLHLYVIRLHGKKLRLSHQQVFEALRAQGIGANLHYIPVHLQPYYQNLGFRKGDFPEAERYYREAVTLPLFPGLTEIDQERVLAILKKVLTIAND